MANVGFTHIASAIPMAQAALPDRLNGYPVIMIERHKTCATVMMVRDPENSPNHKNLVVATWWPALGNTWSWGHYIVGPSSDEAEAEAQEIFKRASKRNAQR